MSVTKTTREQRVYDLLLTAGAMTTAEAASALGESLNGVSGAISRLHTAGTVQRHGRARGARQDCAKWALKPNAKRPTAIKARPYGYAITRTESAAEVERKFAAIEAAQRRKRWAA